MALVTPAILQALGADGGLSDAALTTLISREEAEIVRRFGANYPAPLTERVAGGERSIYLKRAIGSVTSITEYQYPGDPNPLTLTTNDYAVWSDEGRIERVYGRWAYLAVVVYVPTNDTKLRQSVLIELVRLAAEAQSGGAVSGLGFSIADTGGATKADAQRAALYARLGWLSR